MNRIYKYQIQNREYVSFKNQVPNQELEHITFMNTLGFVTYDIVDNHYINNFNMQVDVLFINKNHKFNTIVNELLL